MRILIAAIVVSAGISAADAADLPVEYSTGTSTYSSAIGQRSGTLVVYDVQPGVVVRAYWQAPWRNHHYYPRTGERPEIGRDEDLSAPSDVSERPETFRRYWSTNSLLVEQPRIAPPRAKLPPLPGPLK